MKKAAFIITFYFLQ